MKSDTELFSLILKKKYGEISKSVGYIFLQSWNLDLLFFNEQVVVLEQFDDVKFKWLIHFFKINNLFLHI